jgi:hypothetical protein
MKMIQFFIRASLTLLILVFGISVGYNLCGSQNSAQVSQNSPKPIIDQTYSNKDIGFEFSYPSYLQSREEEGKYNEGNAAKIILSHSIPYKNYGTCDMAPSAVLLNNLVDFNAVFSLYDKSVAETVKTISPYMPEENFTSSTLKASPGFIDEYSVGAYKGFAIYEGAEGCGHVIYYFPIKSDLTLVITKDFVQALSGISTLYDIPKILNIPGAISREKSDEILKKIIESLKILR